jgi:hypothetical protein
MKKKRVIIAILSVFLFFSGVMIPGKTFASVILDEDFDDYSEGEITAQSDWVCENCEFDAGMDTEAYFTSPYSLNALNRDSVGSCCIIDYRNLSFGDTGYITFRFLSLNDEDLPEYQTSAAGFNFGNGSKFGGVELNANRDSVSVGAAGEMEYDFTDIDLYEWHRVKIEYDFLQEEFRYKVDDENFTGWYSLFTNNNNEVSIMFASTPVGYDFVFDDVFVFSDEVDDPDEGGEGEVPASGNDDIEITYPDTIAGNNFENWEITFETATSTGATSTDAYVAHIYASYNTSSTDWIYNECGSSCFRGGAIVHDFESPRDIKNNTSWGEGEVFAFAQLYYQPDRFNDPGYIEQVATSSVISFDISLTAPEGYYETPTSTATSSQWTITCDPDAPGWEHSLCKLGQFLFVPSSDSVTRFGNLGDKVRKKPPFGYWDEIKGEIGNITTSSPAFTLTGMETLAENDVFGRIRNTLTVLLWFLFGFWVLHRIRNFDFQK